MDDPRLIALRRALEMFSSQSAFAAAIGIKQQSANDVFRNNRPAPVKWCIPIEQAVARIIAETGQGDPVTRYQLRPDIYPPHDAPGGAHEALRAAS